MQKVSSAVSPAFGFVVLALLGCSQQQTPLAETPPTEGTSPEEEPSAPADEEGPPRPRGKVAACTTDASCNADPAISALWGSCDVGTGKCSCHDGAELDPISERCNPSAQ